MESCNIIFQNGVADFIEGIVCLFTGERRGDSDEDGGGGGISVIWRDEGQGRCKEGKGLEEGEEA